MITCGFLFTFTLVFLCDYLCDLGLIFPKSDQMVQHHTFSANGHDHQDHTHNHHADSHKPNHSDNEPTDDESEKCCDELTSLFFSSIKSSVVENTNWETIAKSFPIIVFYLSNQYLYKSVLSKSILRYCWQPPPKQGYSIRISLQSFLI